VLARDELNHDAPVRSRRALRRFVSEAEVLELRVLGRTIGTAAEHPFFVRGKGWTKAQDLRPGDELRLESPGWLPVKAAASTGRVEPFYNIAVADDHTYFVGDPAWAWSVWAHNTCYSSPELARAGLALRKGRTNEVIVRNTNEAREVVFREFRSAHGVPSYRDTTGWSKAHVDLHGKTGTYHWDTVFDSTSALDSMKGRQLLRGHYDDGKLQNYTPICRFTPLTAESCVSCLAGNPEGVVWLLRIFP
jgi:hypothetical protein